VPRRRIVDFATASRLDLSAAEVDRVERRFTADAEGDRRVRTAVALAVLGMIAAGGLVATTVFRTAEAFGLPRSWSFVAAGVAIALALALSWRLLIPRAVRPGLRRSLRACGHDVCEWCGYDRSGHEAGAACPECGRQPRTPLGSPED
jgi:hypothetical protein